MFEYRNSKTEKVLISQTPITINGYADFIINQDGSITRTYHRPSNSSIVSITITNNFTTFSSNCVGISYSCDKECEPEDVCSADDCLACSAGGWHRVAYGETFSYRADYNGKYDGYVYVTFSGCSPKVKAGSCYLIDLSPYTIYDKIYENFTTKVTLLIAADQLIENQEYLVSLASSSGGTVSLTSKNSDLIVNGLKIKSKRSGNFTITGTANKQGNYPAVSVSASLKFLRGQVLSVENKEFIVGVVKELKVESNFLTGESTGLTEFLLSSEQEGIEFNGNVVIANRQGIYNVTVVQLGTSEIGRASISVVLIVSIDNLSPVLITSGGVSSNHILAALYFMRFLQFSAVRAFAIYRKGEAL